MRTLPFAQPKALKLQSELKFRAEQGSLRTTETRGIVGAQGPEVPGSWQRPDRLRDDPSRTV